MSNSLGKINKSNTSEYVLIELIIIIFFAYGYDQVSK